MRYAAQTSVSSEKSRLEIERTLEGGKVKTYTVVLEINEEKTVVVRARDEGQAKKISERIVNAAGRPRPHWTVMNGPDGDAAEEVEML